MRWHVDTFRYLTRLKIKVYIHSSGIRYVKWKDVNKALKENGVDEKEFDKIFGVQTQLIDGPYACDVDDALCRLFTGKRRGSQLLFD